MSGESPIRLALPHARQQLSVRALGAGRHFVFPDKAKREWEVAERVYRSVIVDEDGRVLSTGFAKFGNHGEPCFADADQALAAAIADGCEVLVAEKLDGILAIRSVIDGRAVLRTRGSADGEPFAGYMRAVAAERYPNLLDPGFEPDRSLLFEFTSDKSAFQVVLRYPHDDLTLLAVIDHATLRMAGNAEVDQIAARHGLNAMVWTPLGERFTDLCRQVRGWHGREGVVVRTGQHLVKVKSLSYLTLHRLRGELTARRIRETLDAEDLQTVEAWRAHLEARGGDWELLSDSGLIAQALLDARAGARARFDALVAEATAKVSELPDRKSFATLYAAKLPVGQRSAAFLIADAALDRALQKLTAAALDEEVERMRVAEIVVALDAEWE